MSNRHGDDGRCKLEKRHRDPIRPITLVRLRAEIPSMTSDGEGGVRTKEAR